MIMFSLDSKIEDILNNPAAKGVLEKYLPKIADNPVVNLAKGKSLREIAAMLPLKQLGVKQDALENVDKDLKQIK